MLNDKPDWLPAIVSLDGEPHSIFAMLYNLFEEDFKRTKRKLREYPVHWDTRILEGKYEEGFWHLITRVDWATQGRLFDPRRAERLPWCGPSISHSEDVAVRTWDYRENQGQIRTYIWLEKLDYVVILEIRRKPAYTIAFLVTAYHVDGDSVRRNLRTKYDKREGRT